MRINLSEQTWIDLKPASFGSRALAYAADLTFRWTGYLILFAVFALIKPVFFAKLIASLKLGSTLVAAFIIIFFVAEFSYPILFEVFRQGATPGKKLLKIKVVDEQGLAPTFKASLLRNIFSLVDLLPATGLVGLIAMMINKNNQRVGDCVGRTLVVHDVQENFSALPVGNIEYQNEKIFLPLELYNVIDQYLKRKNLFTTDARLKTLSKIEESIFKQCSNLQMLNPTAVEKSSLSERDDTLARLFINATPKKKSNSKSSNDLSLDWKDTRTKINEVINSFLNFKQHHAQHHAQPHEQHGQQTKEKIRLFANSYQQICQIYSYLAAYYPDCAEATKAAYLTREGRQLVYGKRLSDLNASKLSFLSKVSTSFSLIKYHVLAAALISITPGIICFLAVTINPNLSWHFLSEDMAENLAAGKLWTEQIRGQSDTAAAGIMTNNIKVAITAFALGITAGVGTVFVLIQNGIHLAGIFTALAIYGMAGKLFDFVVAHGFLELSVIIVAGGCGLYIADALINPGFISRKEKIQLHARNLVDLLVFNAICLVVAGIVEGYISPYTNLGLAAKLTIGIILGVLYWIALFVDTTPNKFTN